MNPFRNGISALPPLLALLGGLVLAVFLGQSVSATNGRDAWMPAAIAFAIFLAIGTVLGFKQHIWLLVPLAWPLTGSISVLPLPFSVRELGTMAAVGSYMMLFSMKKVRAHIRLDYVNLLVGLNVIYLISAYVRNPVGTHALGSAQVGGRPYLAAMIGLAAFILVSAMRINGKFAFKFPLLLMLPATLVALISFASQIFPWITPFVYPFYSGLSVGEYMGGDSSGFNLTSGRYGSLGQLGLAIGAVAVCYWNPKTMMSPAYFLRVAILGFVGFCILISGFRNMLGTLALTFLVASFLYERGLGLFRTCILGVAGLALLISMQGFVELPRSFQRAMSFLPGTWDKQIVEGANQSTEWRREMWEIALTTDTYIRDKVLGDGFGFSAKELEIMMEASDGGSGFLDADNNKEAFMIQGSFHSGPMSSIRFVGVVGFACYLILAFGLLFYSWKLFKKAKGTLFQPLAIWLAIPAIIQPFTFIFVFGDYRMDLPNLFFNAGMLKLLSGSLEDHLDHEKRTKSLVQEMQTTAAMPVPVHARLNS